MVRSIIAALFTLVISVGAAFAQSCSYPNTLTNGQPADANQVMENFNAILTCLTSITSRLAPQGRVTLASATPVMTSTNGGKSLVYYTPYNGNQIPLYDGTNLVTTTFAEIVQPTTDATKSPAAVAANKNYDIFVWNDSGTIRATRGPAWTSNTARGYTFTRVNGILLNAAAITNGPAALRGTYVGSVASNGSSTIDYILGGSSSGGTAGSLGVWNAYNRVLTVANAINTKSFWSYNSATPQQLDNSAGNQVAFLVGLDEEPVTANASVSASGASGTLGAVISIGLDSTSAIASGSVSSTTQSGVPSPIVGSFSGYSGIGFHTIAALQSIAGSGAALFYGTGSGTGTQTEALTLSIKN